MGCGMQPTSSCVHSVWVWEGLAVHPRFRDTPEECPAQPVLPEMLMGGCALEICLRKVVPGQAQGSREKLGSTFER